MKTKTEYVKVEFANDKELAKAYSEMDLYIGIVCFGSFKKLDTINCVHDAWLKRIDLYKKEEVDVNKLAKGYIYNSNLLDYTDELHDFCEYKMNKHVEKEFVGLCHLIAELTEDPRGK